MAQGNYAGAIADYDSVVSINPDYVGAYNNRGIAKGAQGDYVGAIADVNRAIALDPENRELIASRDSLQRQMNQSSRSPLSKLFSLFKR